MVSFKQFIVLSISVFFLSFLALNAFAQTEKNADLTQPVSDEEEDDSSTLDLFDDDTELTKQGWAQFYVSTGIMFLSGSGEFSVRLPDDREFMIIDFERAGIDESDTSYWASIYWRSANSRWGAWFSSWRYKVDGFNEVLGEIELDDKVIPVGASIESDFDAKWYILEATYSFYRTEAIDTGIGIGFHMVDIDTTITSILKTEDQGIEVVSISLDTLAPLPNILGYFHWKFGEDWNVIVRGGYFGLNYDKYSGAMITAHAMLNYNITPRWTAGLGFQYVDLDLEIEKTNETHIYDFSFAGPIAFVRFSF